MHDFKSSLDTPQILKCERWMANEAKINVIFKIYLNLNNYEN